MTERSNIIVQVMTPGAEDRVIEAAHLFDHQVRETAVRAFLADDRHHLLVAYVDGRPAIPSSGAWLSPRT